VFFSGLIWPNFSLVLPFPLFGRQRVTKAKIRVAHQSPPLQNRQPERAVQPGVKDQIGAAHLSSQLSCSIWAGYLSVAICYVVKDRSARHATTSSRITNFTISSPSGQAKPSVWILLRQPLQLIARLAELLTDQYGDHTFSGTPGRTADEELFF
jgi:hypothetical protein